MSRLSILVSWLPFSKSPEGPGLMKEFLRLASGDCSVFTEYSRSTTIDLNVFVPFRQPGVEVGLRAEPTLSSVR